MSTAVRRQSTDTGRVNLRRQSVDVNRIASNIGRSSMDGTRAAMILTSAQSRPPQGPRMENSYRLEPEKAFPSVSVKKIIQSVFEEMIGDKEYDPAESTLLAGKLADVIKHRVKELGHPRYKIVATVALGPAVMSSVAMVSRCVWNPSMDTFAEYAHKNGKMYACGLVYGLYLE
ncbi:dynein light chain Tctex-type 5-like [Haliotis cracherodii]|uniref:dynein light chain Tctex-type 5-like n=1 Tax=Haliotis cracherodii TaxID=6455 RepID=UPI0039E7E5F5